MSKIGLVSKKEVKFFTGKVLEGTGFGGFLSTVLQWFLPGIINSVDDKYGDRVPEPWQTYLETLITKTYVVLQDDVITVEERNDLANYCAAIINAQVNIKNMPDKHKIQGIMILTQYAATQIAHLLDKKTVVRGQ